jgi:hypothetical protein
VSRLKERPFFGREVRITCHRMDESRLPINQGFRWVSD